MKIFNNLPVISRENLPAKIPINRTIIGFIVIDYYKLPDLILCFFLGHLLAVWAVYIYRFFNEKSVNILDKNKT